jgi:hypothetical protein
MALAVNQNRGGGRLAAIARTAANAGAYVAARYASGAVQGAGKRAYSAGQRYFQGDVNQPITAKTVQRLATMRPVTRRNMGRNAGVVSTEQGSCKLADITIDANSGTGRAIVSLPLMLSLLGGRLYEMSKLFSRWRFLKAVLRYVPSVSSATDGGMVVFYTQEPDDTYKANEIVGSQTASSARDNMELSVREKANMVLHLPSQELYTTFSGHELAWHSAGVVNVVNNGAMVTGAGTTKTYGSLYLDFVVKFTQPSAPFDPWSSIHIGPITPSGTGLSAVGSVFNWLNDMKTSPDVGASWYTSPDGQVHGDGLLYLPPYSTCCISGSGANAAATAMTFIFQDTAIAILGGGVSVADATDFRFALRITNMNPYVAWFYVNNPNATAISAVNLVASLIPYTPF